MSSFYYYLRSLEWLPSYRPLEGGSVERNCLCPSAVYLSSPEVRSLLGNHVCYVDLDPCQFSKDIGKYELWCRSRLPTAAAFQLDI